MIVFIDTNLILDVMLENHKRISIKKAEPDVSI